jgi:3'(2'), 5'-bisphosphate nucleotidase/inositol polyphosphate 1-phosphatase
LQAEELGVVLPPLRMDSQVKYGLLSRGDASIFMRFPPSTYREKIWDHCAGFVIVEEAGGKVCVIGGNETDATGKTLHKG